MDLWFTYQLPLLLLPPPLTLLEVFEDAMDGGGGGGGTYSGRVGSGARVGKGSALDMVGKLKDSALSVVAISDESPPSSSDPPAESVGKGLIFRR